MRFPKLISTTILAAALAGACKGSTAPDPSLPTKGVSIVVDSAAYHLQRRGSLGFRVNLAVTVINDSDHDVFLSQQCGYYALTRTDGSQIELGAYACALPGGIPIPTPIRIGAGARYTKVFDLLGSIQPQARPQITLKDNIGEVKFRLSFTNEAGTAAMSLQSESFSVLPPDPETPPQLDLRAQFIFTGLTGGKKHIFAMDMIPGEPIRVSPDSLNAECPVVSHDGRRILFVGDGDVWVVKADGSEMQRVMAHAPNAFFYLCPSWAPDDRKFVWASMVPITKQPSPGAVYTVDIETGAATTLTTGSNFSSTDWSPDGQHILIASNKYTDGGPFDFSVSVLRLDGTRVSQIVSGTSGAAWAPDGKSFGYLCGQRSPYSLCVADTAGANIRVVTDSIISKPYWSPDGSRIAFVGTSGVFIVNADGTAKHLLSATMPSFDISWSPDARRIAWACSGESGYDICRIGADGTGFTRTSTTVSAAQITWPPLM